MSCVDCPRNGRTPVTLSTTRRRARFALESANRVAVAEQRADHDLDGDLTLQAQIECLEHHAEPAASEPAIEPIFAVQDALDRQRQRQLGLIALTSR